MSEIFIRMLRGEATTAEYVADVKRRVRERRKPQPCPTCKGKGRVTFYSTTGDGEFGYPCPDCSASSDKEKA